MHRLPLPRRRPLAGALCVLALALAPTAAARDAHDDNHNEAVELDAVVVESTRSGRRVSEEPILVKVIAQEEIEEKLLMTPDNIAMLVAETGGVRVQVTSPALGAANIRMQGMRGRYTQLLADGLPLYGGQASSLGLLQIPPTDLGRVEIIKGAASALYGPSALGGVINLISRKPGDERDAELLLNATSRDGHDVTAYTAAPLNENWSGSLVGGFHDQARQDLDDDGWIDMPGYERWTVRPRLFWNSPDDARALVTFGAMSEDRVGGTLAGARLPDGQAFPLTQDTTRFDAGAVIELPMHPAPARLGHDAGPPAPLNKREQQTGNKRGQVHFSAAGTTQGPGSFIRAM